MINLQLELLLLIPFGMFIIKAVQALTDEGGLLRFSIAWTERIIDDFMESIEKVNNEVDLVDRYIKEGKDYRQILPSRKDKLKGKIEFFKLKIRIILFFTKPLYRCPVCMSSIWGTATWLWWAQFSPLPYGTWPIYCLMLCGAMVVLENWIDSQPDVYINNEIGKSEEGFEEIGKSITIIERMLSMNGFSSDVVSGNINKIKGIVGK